uniref:Uncharacterized protein n=1 Tax=Schizaphis graminum TaxID=13262 RepID=A0A2S2NF85_SCHGA
MRERSGAVQTMWALVDSASQVSIITAACVKRLGLKPARWTAPISGLSRTTVAEVQGRVECIVQPRFASDPVLPVQAWVLPTITTLTSDLPQKSLAACVHIRRDFARAAERECELDALVSLHLASPRLGGARSEGGFLCPSQRTRG